MSHLHPTKKGLKTDCKRLVHCQSLSVRSSAWLASFFARAYSCLLKFAFAVAWGSLNVVSASLAQNIRCAVKSICHLLLDRSCVLDIGPFQRKVKSKTKPSLANCSPRAALFQQFPACTQIHACAQIYEAKAQCCHLRGLPLFVIEQPSSWDPR